MSTPDFQSQANLSVSWLDGREAHSGDVVIYATGIELDEVLDALVAGLKATQGRTYTVELAEIAEIVTREAIARPRVVIPTRPVKPRPSTPRPDVPVTPVITPPAVRPGENDPSPATPGESPRNTRP